MTLQRASLMAINKKSPASEQHTVGLYLRQLNSLGLIRQLSLLLMEAQKHRGISMAVLEGDVGFESSMQHEQAVIQRLMNVITQLNQQSDFVIEEDQWQLMNTDWQSLTDNWRNDTAMTNFEFHSSFIESIVNMIWTLCEKSVYFVSLYPGKQTDRSKHVDSLFLYSENNHHALVKISLSLMPALLEVIAKLRGLATHISVRGHCDAQARARFSPLLQALNINKEHLREASKSLQHDALRAVPALPSMLLYEHRLDQLQKLITNEIMIDGEIGIDGHDVFDFATGIIDDYSKIVSDAISAFQRRIEMLLLVT